jgi:hypothetical protein
LSVRDWAGEVVPEGVFFCCGSFKVMGGLFF